ncbi:MAG TPA: hypothetical protein VMV44_10380, partial [Rectinemataceae bacterium]|nr:hypothetical protein [Rectinemataceae bacterium]
MGSNKWRLPESLLLLCGILLGLYLLRLPIALPSFLLPERVYIAFPLGTPIEVLRSAVGSTHEAFAILPDSLYRMPSLKAPTADWRRLQAALPDRPVFDALEAELARTDFPALLRVRLVAGFVPTAEEIARLSSIARSRGLPLSIRLLPPPSRPGIASYSWRTGELGEAFDFELLFSPES